MNKHSQIIDQALDLRKLEITFETKPLIIGGLAMEYYGLRKRGKDIDLLITNEEYHELVARYPNNRKDIWGDLGIVVHEFEIWRSINLLDYDFYSKDAIEFAEYKVVSFERLLMMRVAAMRVEKYKNDLDLMMKHYYKSQNQEFLQYAQGRHDLYKSVPGGIIFNNDLDKC